MSISKHRRSSTADAAVEAVAGKIDDLRGTGIDTLDGLAAEMHDRDITHVPVLDGGKLVGIVARGDLVRFLSRTS